MLTTHLAIEVEVEVQELELDLQVDEVSAITPNNSSNPNPNPTIPQFHNSTISPIPQQLNTLYLISVTSTLYQL